jgi:hypothetical protein
MAYDLDSTITLDARSELEALAPSSAGIGGRADRTDTWGDAVRVLQIPARAPHSLAAWAASGNAPPNLRHALQEARPRGGELP